MVGQQVFEDELEACISTLLRKEYPFTQTSIINEVASSAAFLAAREIVLLTNEKARRGVRAIDFLDLAPELRNRIYEYAVTADEPIRMTRFDVWQCVLQPAITRVSRQLRRETLSMLYKVNTFRADISRNYDAPPECTDIYTKMVNAWLRAIGPENTKYIRNFTAEYWRYMIPDEACLDNGQLKDEIKDKLLREEGLSLVAKVTKLVRR